MKQRGARNSRNFWPTSGYNSDDDRRKICSMGSETWRHTNSQL